MRPLVVALAFVAVLASPALASSIEEKSGQGWSRSYGVGACVNCPEGTGLMAGEDVGKGMMNAASGMFGAVLAPFRAPAEAEPPPEVFNQKPPQGLNCWVDAGAGQGYWAHCP